MRRQAGYGLSAGVMRGVLWIAFLLASCVAPSATDSMKKFGPRQAVLADGALDAVIMPPKIAAFELRPSKGLFPSTGDGQRQYTGIYESLDGREILFTAILNGNAMARQQAVNTAASCAEAVVFATSSPDVRPVYSYWACRGQFQFTWINGNWILSAASYQKAGIQELLTFLDAYPY